MTGGSISISILEDCGECKQMTGAVVMASTDLQRHCRTQKPEVSLVIAIGKMLRVMLRLCPGDQSVSHH